MLITAFFIYRTPTLPLPHTQLNQYHLDLLSGLVLSPLRTTSHIVLEDILLSLHSHAIDNEHSALVPWTYNLFDCRQLLPPTSRLVASMSGLANNCSITTLYALYAHGTLERPFRLIHQPTERYLLDFCLATAATRTSVYFSYTLRPSNRHYFPSKSFSPSSQYIALEKEEPYLRCSWPMNSPRKPPHRLMLTIPRVLDAFRKW